jgi:SAM-dependent methyltransferase
MNVAVMEETFQAVAAMQGRFDHAQHPNKLLAKERAITLLTGKLSAGARVLDVGGEEFYQGPLRARHEVTTLNLPDDMHAMEYEAEFDGALAMHVLEHSPAPLYMLNLLHRALVPGGWLYVAVPKPCATFCKPKYGHVSILPDLTWRHLLATAGFRLQHTESGSFGRRKRWVEYRYLAERV